MAGRLLLAILTLTACGCNKPREIVIGVVSMGRLNLVAIQVPNGRFTIQYCEFDNTPVTGHYVTMSTRLAGYCHDTGIKAPNNEWEMQHE